MKRLLIVLCLAGCTSDLERAQQLLEAEAPVEAAAAFERILAKDPANPEARVGLGQARTKALENDLIAVRMARLGGDPDKAADQLQDVIVRSRKWQVTFTPAVMSTQDEELGFSSKYLRAKLLASLRALHPLASYDLMIKYQAILETGTGLAPLRREISAIGATSCRQLEHKAHGPFSSDLILRYCRFFEQEPSLAIQKAAKTRSEQLFSGISIKASGSLAPAVQAELKDTLSRAFVKTAWFDPASPSQLEVDIKGDLVDQISRRPVIRTFEYTETETYTEYERVQKTRQIEEMETKTTIDPYSGRELTTRVPHYRSETYWETEPQTRTREVPRTLDYQATEVRRTLKIDVSAGARLGGAVLESSRAHEDLEGGDEHDVSRPALGLSPSRPKLSPVEDWVATQFEPLAQDFADKAVRRWTDLYCGRSPRLALEESVELCLAQSHQDPPAFVESWYQSELGLPAKDAFRLLHGGPDQAAALRLTDSRTS